ncbi:Kunitz-type serine protease inhibitor 6 [Lamellibrachia satsuma]|nr:Kunitz-type serine protease inhibitor 6 [Lamellibrachia satsuma]
MFNWCLLLLLGVYAGGAASASPPPLLGRCPPVKGPGVCAELCVNCAARGMVCCSNGCGHQCMKPVSPVSPPRPHYCYLPAVKGLCKAYVPSWFYNKRTGLCEKFIYGGCGGNRNRFPSELACKMICRAKSRPCNPIRCLRYCRYGFKKDKYGCPTCSCLGPPRPLYCYLPAVKGLCKAYMPSWFYNKRTGSCEKFIYGGCGGNRNRFPSQLACMVTCRVKKRRCSPVMCTLYCKYGFKRDQYGCPICACRLPPRPLFCYLPAVKGLCKAYMPSWFYNKRTGSCEKFIYGGCGGNRNRFSSQLACMVTCRVKKRRCSPVMCTLYCKYGFKRDQYGCPICACRLPRKNFSNSNYLLDNCYE